MKHAPDPAAHSPGAHPDAAKPLSAFRRVVVTCNDCGDATVLDEAALAELSAVPTLGDLGRLAFCRACRDGGQGSANVDVRGEAARATASAEPRWSNKPVFGENRGTPFPQLPRRPMFKR